MGQITFDDYWDLFIADRSGNPWSLIKYYLLSDINEFGFDAAVAATGSEARSQKRQDYKTRVIEVGNAIRDSYIARRNVDRFTKEVLGGQEASSTR